MDLVGKHEVPRGTKGSSPALQTLEWTEVWRSSALRCRDIELQQKESAPEEREIQTTKNYLGQKGNTLLSRYGLDYRYYFVKVIHSSSSHSHPLTLTQTCYD